jgi:predicted patatin/cPLA2 family phospholipase
MSSPKEKAKELVYKFDDTMEFSNPQRFAKQCALIAVDFALDYVNGDLNEAFDKTLYLLEVKEEIEKL